VKKSLTLIALIGTVKPFGNKGDEAIYITSIQLIRKHLKKVKILLASPEFNPSYKKLRKYRADIITRHPMGALSELLTKRNTSNSFQKSLAKYIYYHTPPLISALISKKLPSTNYKTIKNINTFVIASHPLEAAGFSTYISSFIIPRYLNPQSKVIAFPLSLSTKMLNNFISRSRAKNALNKANIIFTRGNQTAKLLKQHLKLKNVVASFDPAITLSKTEPKEKPLKGIAVVPAGLSVNPLFLAKLIENLIETLEKHVYIIPFSLGDIPIAHKLFNLVKNKDSCNVIDTSSMSPQELKGFLSHVEMLITSRVHAAIFALGEHIPTIGILREDDIKFYDVLGTFKLDKYIFNPKITPTKTLNQIISTARTFIDNRTDIVKLIKQKLPLAVAKAENTCSILKKVVTGD